MVHCCYETKPQVFRFESFCLNGSWSDPASCLLFLQCLINFAMALAEMKQQQLDTPSTSMILVNLFQLLYVIDGLWNEVRVASECRVWERGTSCLMAVPSGGHPDHHGLDARWLWLHVGIWWPGVGSLHLHSAGVLPSGPPQPSEPPWPRCHHHSQRWVWGWRSLPLIWALRDLTPGSLFYLLVIGFYIFRKSNSEKNNFRRNPADPNLARKLLWFLSLRGTCQVKEQMKDPCL